MTSLDINVYDAALERIGRVYDWCDDVVVSMSGGKDSTVLLHLTEIVAAERSRLPVKVYWLDQEAEWRATVDYMTAVLRRPEIEPYWYQFPFRLRNSLSHTESFLHCWDPAAREVWLHEPDPISIKVNPLRGDRFSYCVKNLPTTICPEGKHVGVLVGVRMAESLFRQYLLRSIPGAYNGIKWSHRRLIGNTRTFWPIYDWEDPDVFACIAKNELPHNAVYDSFYRFGISPRMMRVSSLIHETAWHAMRVLQVVEPETYDRLLRRVSGISTFSHLIDDIVPKELPQFFKSWLEYRDYLLEALVEPEHRDKFRSRWRTQHGDKMYRVHVSEVVLNDIDRTKNLNGYLGQRMKNWYVTGANPPSKRRTRPAA